MGREMPSRIHAHRTAAHPPCVSVCVCQCVCVCECVWGGVSGGYGGQPTKRESEQHWRSRCERTGQLKGPVRAAIISRGCINGNNRIMRIWEGRVATVVKNEGIKSGVLTPSGAGRRHGDRPAAESISGSHLELPRLVPGRVRAHHQLLVRGDA